MAESHIEPHSTYTDVKEGKHKIKVAGHNAGSRARAAVGNPDGAPVPSSLPVPEGQPQGEGGRPGSRITSCRRSGIFPALLGPQRRMKGRRMGGNKHPKKIPNPQNKTNPNTPQKAPQQRLFYELSIIESGIISQIIKLPREHRGEGPHREKRAWK